ncbi:methylated-DNA--[protein]-cysteine S-methyltransferase [Xylophilus rhododendri]|uniref:Methylated-DNA--protein-cysteine methyltransferase n=1 Tax=Xylophilus rhododendri TaxID=2697032 RepID=A0A857J1P5_9BURK|nr:methylated-DNA--[protein]-cysteine S-methyltransferase [Xylophilus rhododendri]QHI97163.1 methylated-DNA--[protein]-cysteine S-methyltransferase [Xylophilus rhododendri]
MKYAQDTVQRRWISPLGAIDLAATPRGLAGLWFDDHKYRPAALDAPDGWPRHDGPHAVLDATERELQAYFDGRLQRFEVPIELPAGTEFQMAVWAGLLKLDHGQTCSYGALAVATGRPSAVRAVGAAVGRNPVSILVPCHRVVGGAGALTGYAGGLPRKSALLALEQPQRNLTGLERQGSAA